MLLLYLQEQILSRCVVCGQVIVKFNPVQSKQACAEILYKSSALTLYVTLDHKTSHKGLFFEIEIYASSESWINKLSIDVWKSGIWGCKKI